jgi:hypothetical protein
MAENTLYFGDNLKNLRDNIREDGRSRLSRSAVQFQSQLQRALSLAEGHESHALITAFEDT